MAPTKRRSYDMILGSFVALGLLALLVLVLIGRERRLFDTTVAVEAHFPNVAGLAVGADVLLGGVVVGHVSSIKFPVLLADVPGMTRDISVVMEISKRAMSLIKEDSIARIDSKGLLGDKLINITIGSPELPEVQAGGMLQSTPPIDFNRALQQAQEILSNVTETVAEAKDIFKGFVSHGGDEALASSAKSLKRIFKEVESGKGILHELIFDEEAGRHTKESIKSLKHIMAEAEKISPEAAKAISHLEKSLAQLSKALDEINHGSGIAHDLIYADDKGNFIRSLNQAGRDIEALSQDLTSGKGSLGLLIKDPSLYNRLYELIGNLERSWLLKKVIRHNISQAESKRD